MTRALFLIIACCLECVVRAASSAGQIDESFAPVTVDVPAEMLLAVGGDGRIIVAGRFTQVNGKIRNHIARLQSDGSLDESFVPELPTPLYVTSIAIQSDGRVLVADGVALRRLNVDGSLDGSFQTETHAEKVVVGPADEIYATGIYVSGRENSERRFLVRLNGNGEIEVMMPTTWWCGCGMTEDGIVVPAVQGEEVILAGYFATAGGHNSLARFNADGSEDLSFNAITRHWDTYPRGLVVQPDGKIVYHSSRGGDPLVTRFHADGTRDGSFTWTPDLYSRTEGFAVDPGGKVLISGTRRSTLPPREISRLGLDGNVDPSFEVDLAYSDVHSIAALPNGRILLGGSFKITEDDAPLAVVRLRGDPVVVTGFQTSAGETQIDWKILDSSRIYKLEASDDLKTWTLVRSIEGGATKIEHQEPPASRRFFRVSSQ